MYLVSGNIFASKSVEAARRHEPERLALHVQCLENFKTHIMRMWMFSSLLLHRLLACVGTIYLNIVCFVPEECMNVEWITQSLKTNFCECRSLAFWGNKRKSKQFEALWPCQSFSQTDAQLNSLKKNKFSKKIDIIRLLHVGEVQLISIPFFWFSIWYCYGTWHSADQTIIPKAHRRMNHFNVF
jgi:hypothetical protein